MNIITAVSTAAVKNSRNDSLMPLIFSPVNLSISMICTAYTAPHETASISPRLIEEKSVGSTHSRNIPISAMKIAIHVTKDIFLPSISPKSGTKNI